MASNHNSLGSQARLTHSIIGATQQISFITNREHEISNRLMNRPIFYILIISIYSLQLG